MRRFWIAGHPPKRPAARAAGLAAALVPLGLALPIPAGSAQTQLPGTAPLTSDGDFVVKMLDGLNRFLVRETFSTRERRALFWKRDYSSPGAYETSVSPNREKLRRIIGVVDPRVDQTFLEMIADAGGVSTVGQGTGYSVHAVRWPVFKGVMAEGLMLRPKADPVARVVAIPDADWSPEMLSGLQPGVVPRAQFARRLAESGCLVLIPTLIDRKDTWSGIPGVRMTNLPHREWIYRMAYEAGRHIIGFEVQAVLAAVDWFFQENSKRALPVAIAGYGEGGLIALYSAALDRRIDATLVSGYFQPREDLWKEPVYRDVWSFIREFGDAEIASLVAPRALVVESSQGPNVSGPPPVRDGRSGATPNGTLSTPLVQAVRSEAERARSFFAALKVADKLTFVVSDTGYGPPGSDGALVSLLRAAGVHTSFVALGGQPQTDHFVVNPGERLHRQFDRWVDFTQKALRESPRQRQQFWAKLDTSSPRGWRQTSQYYRDYIWDEILGRLPPPTLPINPRTRLIYDQPTFRGYEVMLDVWPDVFAYGILLLPKNLKPGERRPVVVCQHGLEGSPREITDPAVDAPPYHRWAARLAEEGFIAYAPQNPYFGRDRFDRFRSVQRRAHPLKLTLFSFILGQHQRLLEWLASLPFVDAQRIGFYGLSYGGKTAVRVPPLLPQYALSICSGDFNEWVWKTTSVDSKYSYLITNEYDMVEFDFANVVNYAELAGLMAPRPFMVERGHNDGVAPDEWVAYEFAKLKRFYVTQMHLTDRAAIEFFDGPHEIHGKGSFAFLRRHLKWPD